MDEALALLEAAHEQDVQRAVAQLLERLSRGESLQVDAIVQPHDPGGGRVGESAITVVPRIIAGLLAFFGTGLALTLLIAGLGAFMFGVNSLIQAWALDLADGKNLEGTMMGSMYGINMIFQGLAPLLSMLNSCAANVAVVNIDAGFKAGYLAGLIATRRSRCD